MRCDTFVRALLRALGNRRVAELSLVIPYSAVGALVGSQEHEAGAEGLRMMEGLRKIAVEVVAPDPAHGGGGGSSMGLEDGALEALAALINASSTTLVRLSLTTRGHVTDLAPLFVALRPLPVLTHLALSIPCEARHLSDPVALTRFLSGASALTSFAFAPKLCCSPALHGHADADAHDAWCARAFSARSLNNVTALSLAPDTGGTRVHPALAALSAACAGTPALRLRIAGRIRALDELRVLLGPFVAGGAAPTHADANTAGTGGRGGGRTGLDKGGGEDSHEVEPHGTEGPAERGREWKNGLDALAIEVHVLDVALLALLVRLLPDLCALEVRYDWVGAAGGTDAVRSSLVFKQTA